jgi:pyrroline-5-carboxylate reductase
LKLKGVNLSILLKQKKVGFIGGGNLAQSIIAGLLDSKTLEKDQIFVSNRTDKKLKKIEERFGIQTRSTNEEIIDECRIIILATKPQDLLEAIEPIASSFTQEHLVISLAAGFSLETLAKTIYECGNLAKVMCNVAVRSKDSMMAYSLYKDGPSAADTIEELFSPLGKIIEVDDDEAMAAFTVSSSAGIGFVLELMQHWQDWIEGYGFDKDTARLIASQTFLGAARLSLDHMNLNSYELINQIASKKGVTEAGLLSMRETDIDRVLRISFEKALMRDKELGK